MRQPASVLCLITLLTFGFLIGCDHEQSLERQLEKAKEDIAEHEHKSAILRLKTLLQSTPDNLEARVLLGESYLEIGDGDSAEKEFIRASELGLADPLSQLNLAKALRLSQDYSRIMELEAPKGMDDRQLAEWLTIRGDSHLAFGHHYEAQLHFEEALELDPNAKKAMLGLAQLTSDPEEAKNWISQSLLIDQEYSEAWLLLGAIELKQGNLQEAEEAYTKSIGSSENQPLALISRSLLRIERGRYAEAEEDLVALKSLAKENYLVNYVEGIFYFRQAQYKEAQEPLQAAIAANPDFPPALLAAGANDLQLGNFSGAESALSKYLAIKPDNRSAQQLLANLMLQDQNYVEAERLARSALEQAPDDVVSLELLAHSLSRQQSPESVRYLRQALEVQPESATNRSMLGKTLYLFGDTEQAIQELQKALELDPHLQTAADPLVLMLLKQNQTEKALATALTYRNGNPEQAEAHLLVGMVYLLTDDNPASSAAFQTALDLDPENIAALAGLASLELRNDDLEAAKKLYKRALKIDEGNVGTLINLARVEALQGDSDAVRSALERAVELNPQSLKPRIYLASRYLYSGKAMESASLLSEVEPDHPDNVNLKFLLAESYLAIEDVESLKRTLDLLNKLIPDDAYVHYLFAKMYYAMNDRANMRAELREAIALEPEYTVARIALTQDLIHEKQYEEVDSQLAVLKDQGVGDKAHFKALQGQLSASRGDMNSAIPAFEEALKLAPTTINLTRLAKAKWAVGDQSMAVGLLEDWLEKYPKDDQVLSLLGGFYLVSQRGGDAITAFEKVVELAPEDVSALNNLAWLLRKSDPPRALGYAERANTLKPDNSAIMDTLALALLEVGNLERAERVIDGAIALEPDEPTFQYHRLVILERAGRNDEALREVKIILEKWGDFPEKAEAKAMLARLDKT